MLFACLFACVYIFPLDRGSMENLAAAGVRVEGHYDVECTIGGEGSGRMEISQGKIQQGRWTHTCPSLSPGNAMTSDRCKPSR